MHEPIALPPEPRTEPLKSRRLRRYAIAGLILIAVVGFYGYLLFRDDRVGRLRAELDRTDPGWRMEDIWANYERSIPDDDKNPLAVALAAGNAVPAGIYNWCDQPDALPMVLRESDSPFAAVDPQILVIARTKLDELSPALELAHKLRATRNLGGSRTTLGLDGIGTLMPHVDTISRLQKVLKFEGDYAALIGDSNRAMNAACCLVQSGRALGDEPFYISQAIRRRGSIDAIAIAERTLARGSVRDDLLAELRERLAEELSAVSAVEILRMERASIDRFYQNFADGRDSITALSARYGLAVPGSVPIQSVYFATQRSKEHRDYLMRFNGLIEIARAPEPERIGRYQKLEPFPGQRSIVAKLINALSGTDFLFQDDLVRTARIRSAIAALDCERHRMKSGIWPKSIEERPDPFSGKPLILRTRESGIAIYSVGPDGEDNGGVFETNLKPKAGHDVGITLLDPDRRGK
jgi:hypothetical protein